MFFWRWEPCFFKVDSTILGTFQSSSFSVGAPSICTSSTIKFLGVEGPFLDEMGSSNIVCCNCCLEECRSLLAISSVLLEVISAIDSFTTVGAFILLDGRFMVVLLEYCFVGKESGTLFAFVLGSYYQTLHWLLNLLHFLVSLREHGFELSIS